MEESFISPSPSETPYRTPSSSRSRQSRPYSNMSPSSSPPPLPSDERPTKRRSNESINDALNEDISPLDPRRFTPTLHASLVSEILSLRRDVENKDKDIDQLETNLQVARTENETIHQQLATSQKESRSHKRQLQLLEGGSLSALSEIASERDTAIKELEDARKRLESLQKRARTHEENAERTQMLWNQDKEAWDGERRTLETKLHISEGRLKAVLGEIADAGLLNPDYSTHEANTVESPTKRSWSVLSHRRQSAASTSSDHLGGRLSALGITNGFSSSLADELALHEGNEDHAVESGDEDGRISPDALPEEQERPISRLSLKARKVLGFPSELEDADVSKNRERLRAAAMANGSTEMPRSGLRFASPYTDTAVQYSPPPSPEKSQVDFAQPRHFAESRDLRLPVPPIGVSRDADVANPVSPVSPMSFRGSGDWGDAPWYDKPSTNRCLMVTAACQTIEILPSPPLTPDATAEGLATIPESALERAEVKSCSTQTEEAQEIPKSEGTPAVFHDVRNLSIPTIAIIPPGSRPATPETYVVLPPRTKNASCQVSLQSSAGYSSTAMQTEEIRVDKRAIKLPASILSHSYHSHAAAPSTEMPLAQAPTSAVSNTSRRRFRQTPTPPAMLNSKTLRKDSQGETGPYPADHDLGPVSNEPEYVVNRAARSGHQFTGLEANGDEYDDRFGNERLEDEDIFNRPTVKYTLKSGKLIHSDSMLEDIGEMSPAAVGEIVALENLRMSEESLRPEMRRLPGRPRSPPKRTPFQTPSQKSLRRVPSANSNNFRRAALIQSGTAAHRSSQSTSTVASSVDPTKPPPFPVPARFSSKRPGKSWSEGGRGSPTSAATSPTKRERQRTRKPMLRKVRSGPASSPGPSSRRQGSESPPLNPRVSIVPDMPSFRMPIDSATAYQELHSQTSVQASAPRPSVATGPNRRMSHTKTNSDTVSMQQTSVVDAIAQTMVGEWMYKYVRRRKSFGVPESKPADWESKNVEELSANVTSNGIRHKRWVWLAPYERAVMWSSKQPTTGTALLGKSGRKLIIQSVLDVKDDNPMPKGMVGPHFNRSILILTPQRALKFTATSQDRHYVWLTALSFLSHSPLNLGDLAALPPPSRELNRKLPPPSLAGSLSRRPIRDSIRIAKGAGLHGLRSFTTDGSLPVHDPTSRPPTTEDFYDPLTDAAQAPTVPRYAAHTRKRSNTAPRAPPSSFRSLAAKDVVPAIPGGSAYSYNTTTTSATPSDRGVYTPSLGIRSAISSRRGSEASAMTSQPSNGQMSAYCENGSASGPVVGNMNATMRMDAFVDGRPKGSYRTKQGRRKDMGYWDIRGGVPGAAGGRDSVSPVEMMGDTTYNLYAGGLNTSREVDPFRGF